MAHLERAGVSDEIKEEIIFWLGQMGSPENAIYLRDFYAKTTSPALKEKVLFSVSQMSLPENARWLMGIAQDARESMEIRKSALFWAGQMKQVAFADLAAMYDQVQDHEMKEQLIFVYSQRSTPEAVDRLMQIARTETDPEQGAAIAATLGARRVIPIAYGAVGTFPFVTFARDPVGRFRAAAEQAGIPPAAIVPLESGESWHYYGAAPPSRARSSAR